MPKSASGPPGLWLAERISPPTAPRRRIRWLAAGVESRPARPTTARPKPLAAAILNAVWITSALRNRPSPPTTSVAPARPSTASNTDCRKACA